MSPVPFFRKKLLSWYCLHKRDLPWRRTNSPYHIWISEIFLQQTKVSTVIPYYLQFIKRFPSIEKLASADLQDALKCCEGIGYYSRIRNMHRTAQIIEHDLQGKFPVHFSDLLKLPGIGLYTAAAICSIAYDQRIAAVDGNVLRVLSRIFTIRGDITSLRIRDKIRVLASAIMPLRCCGEFNQALMDLGAIVCLAKNPLCDQCPVAGFCAAKRLNIQDRLPVRRKRKAVPHYHIAVGLIWKNGKLLITRRKEKGRLGGLWEFPGGKIEKGESIEHCIQREIMEEVNISVVVKDFFMQLNHTYTHFRITLYVYHCQWVEGVPRCTSCTDWRWVKVDQLDQFPFPKANKKIIAALIEQQS
jgi:A/G-specific adenine glycosylase